MSVRTVTAEIAVGNSAFVENHAVVRKCFYKSLCRPLHLALSVGVLNTKIENAAGLVSQTLANGYGEHSAEVNEACGAGSKTCYLCALGELSGREACFHVIGSFGDIGEKKLS